MKKIIGLFVVLFLIGAVYLFFSYNKPLKNSYYNTQTTNKSNKDYVSLTIVGDLLFESPFYRAVEDGYDYNEYFKEVEDYFSEDDLTIGNMEVVIGNDKLKVSGDGYNFCAPEYIGSLISKMNFEVLSTVNNHSFDRGKEGIYSSIDYFKNNSNILTIGTYKDDVRPLHIVETNNIKFGFLAYTYGTNQKPSNTDEGLINYYKNMNTGEIYYDRLKSDIESLKKEVDVIIVLMHWGIEFTYTPNKEQKELAKFLNEQQVDIVIGSHSHSIQPIEIIGDDYKTLVYYSLGNFTSQDDDIARTKKGDEEFDNAYQFGLISFLNIKVENNNVLIDNIKSNIVVNYFDEKLNNFKLIPLDEYNEEYEKTHFRYQYGLTKDFIKNTYYKVISEEFR